MLTYYTLEAHIYADTRVVHEYNEHMPFDVDKISLIVTIK